MSCEHVRPLLEAYHDHEVDAERAAIVERHIVECPSCAADLRRLSAISTVISREAPPHRAPDRVLRALDSIPVQSKPGWWFAGGTVTGLAVAACVWFMLFLSSRNSIQGAIVDDYVRSNLANHLLDVVSSDRHTVKPWFRGRLDFSPPVPDLARSGFPLIGGRLEYVDARPAAALVYGLRKHIIDLFVLRGTDAGAPASALRGYSIVHWTQDGLSYWAVSDVSRSDLEAFASAYRSRAAQ